MRPNPRLSHPTPAPSCQELGTVTPTGEAGATNLSNIIPLPRAESPEARFLRELAEREEARREIARLDESIKAFCRSYSDARRYLRYLTEDQVRAELRR